MNLDETIAERMAEYQGLMADIAEKEALRLALKDELAKLSHAKAALGRMTPEESAALGISVVEGEIIQELPPG